MVRQSILGVLAGALLGSAAGIARASDHLDSPTVIADPRADIGDLFAWTSPDGQRLNLVMAMVGHTFSDKLEYVFHVDSGAGFGKTTATTSIICRFDAASVVDCRAGEADRAQGNASTAGGIEGRKHRLRVFAGLRDDPFFNNVKGTRQAYLTAAAAVHDKATMDAAGCPNFDQPTSHAILDQWRHTDGGAAKDFLAGWTPAALVVSVDLDVVSTGGKMLAVWATTATAEAQLDRMGRPLTGNALLGTLASADVSNKMKEQYNRASPAEWPAFVPEIQQNLGLYDGFDGTCGNQLLAELGAEPSRRYRWLAELLADDRLWVNGAAAVYTRFFAVELANVAGQGALQGDCGGRTPTYDAVDVYRSLLANGTPTGVDDGVDRDDHEHSTSQFPFLAAPTSASTAKR